MEKGMTCEHLNKLVHVLGKELWQSKEALTCFDCGCPGPNLWICLQPECHHVGCSEVKNDHSTFHHKNFATHCVHMNVSTERIWCYSCEKEVHIRAAMAHSAQSPDSTTADGSVRIGSVGLYADDDVDPDEMEYDEDSRPRGLVGLQNMGNTCYMNAALQALSHTAPLTSYFLECAAAVNILAGDKKPGISRAYQKLIQEMWSRKSRGYVVPNGILYGIRNVHPMFRGYHQHDTQEFLRCFMDQLHEELKEPIYNCTPNDKLDSEADGDHHGNRKIHVRRRAASSGASDAPFFARMRRKSPAPASYNDSAADGYYRIHNQETAGTRHKRSASFAGMHQFTYNAHTQQLNGPTSNQRDVGSESELSCSSEPEERYETCSSGASDAPDSKDKENTKSGSSGDGSNVKYRSIISDVFDGKLLSAVQCLICDRVSTRIETFQDLSLPIPSREHLAVLRCQQPMLNHHAAHNAQESWVWWLLSWLRSWFYGPVVSLQDCLAAFFSADELKGDNMYSCSRCKKLRNGVKLSGIVVLPEVLCVHLKRFRHELLFSAKVAARVAFPINDLDMTPYTHKECTSSVSRYSLAAVISHTGTAGGGHYTCAVRAGAGWYSFDDHAVAPLHVHQLAAAEAYVLFYRKVNPQMAVLREKAAEILESASIGPNDPKYYISKQWINKFNTWAEPGPVDNSDFVCSHGEVRPDREPYLAALAVALPPALWDFLHKQFGGGPAVRACAACGACGRAARRVRARAAAELHAFSALHAAFQEQEQPCALYAVSMHWFRQWQAFVRNKSPQPPPPVDNSGIVTKQDVDGVVTYTLKQGSDHAQLNHELWRFFVDIYGGGPEVKIRSHSCHQIETTLDNRRLSRKYSESDKEDYCSKSTSEADIRDSIQAAELQKNQSLQNINGRKISRASGDSDDDVTYQYKRHEPNGNYGDSGDEPASKPRQHRTRRLRSRRLRQPALSDEVRQRTAEPRRHAAQEQTDGDR
ncbi:ubiquitin carboxyl-terminal hydrolase 20 isoform X1 [Bombyx mandarina]|uniref:Ubiquitin carboxyl-terminal hydrolase n=2 Tax=Bombyx mandarina TaxID=7092 RepID=A0A6J2JXH4_BOMMA|nr:ubiquitin carboxyl-terminal hydrolase 20 isoform X1 [Bombyx mandarina]